MPEEIDGDKVNCAGLFRCCTETLKKMYQNGPAKIAEEGQELRCSFHPDNPNHVMIFENGCWRWHYDAK